MLISITQFHYVPRLLCSLDALARPRMPSKVLSYHGSSNLSVPTSPVAKDTNDPFCVKFDGGTSASNSDAGSPEEQRASPKAMFRFPRAPSLSNRPALKQGSHVKQLGVLNSSGPVADTATSTGTGTGTDSPQALRIDVNAANSGSPGSPPTKPGQLHSHSPVLTLTQTHTHGQGQVRIGIGLPALSPPPGRPVSSLAELSVNHDAELLSEQAKLKPNATTLVSSGLPHYQTVRL